MINRAVLLTVRMRESDDEAHLYLKRLDLREKGTRRWLNFLNQEGSSKRVLVSFNKERNTITVEIGKKGKDREKRTLLEEKNIFKISKQFSRYYINAFTNF